MKIGFDLDGVLYDFVSCARRACELEFSECAGDFAEDAEVWDFYKHQWGLSDEEFWRAVRKHPDTFNSQKLDPAWLELFDELHVQGHTTHVVTARSLHRANTLAWLDESGLHFDSIHFTADKSMVDVDVLIDDSPDNLRALHGKSPVWLVCYDQPYNQDVWECSYRAVGVHGVGVTLATIADRIAEASAPVTGTETVLEEAQRLVYGDRGADYGHPIEDFTRTGRIWAAILGIADVSPEEVALCMIGVKMSREVNKPKRDNAVDMAGYAATLAMVREVQGV